MMMMMMMLTMMMMRFLTSNPPQKRPNFFTLHLRYLMSTLSIHNRFLTKDSRMKEIPCSKYYRVLKGGCPREGGNWGTLRIPSEDWGTLGNIRDRCLEPQKAEPIRRCERGSKHRSSQGVWKTRVKVPFLYNLFTKLHEAILNILPQPNPQRIHGAALIFT